MGNCQGSSSSRVDSTNGAQILADPSNPSSKTGLSFPSTRTKSSACSSSTAPSFSGKSSGGSLPTPRTEGEILSSSNVKAFTFNELRSATRNFRPDSLLGEGGFGSVFKAGAGMVVAVKKLNPESFQGHKEWLTEVQYLGQLHHPNLVKLIGYCSEGDNRLLVYEFMSKGSLENHLFRRGSQPLSWAIRLKVAVGAARGLSFLHDSESQVIYRDVKASNILLDADFLAKLSDFGLAKAGPTGDKTHVSTQVMGTHGYAAPEYIATGRLSAKADVYSFGVVLLELLTGRRAVDKDGGGGGRGVEQSLVDWCRLYLGDRRKYPKKAAIAVAALAAQCTTDEAKLRPRMSEVLAALEQLLDRRETPPVAAPPVGRRPGGHGEGRRSPLGTIVRCPPSRRPRPVVDPLGRNEPLLL
ncbi:unnamed protein product [Spirodela intermedia]|uniref:non-specific serine/threonine protein kinase n=1 Tax=Spirodela intermedia TaxID=51605 RepID=A0A7I8J514_SPIIN|nr:unnamed protein product [Spirodela intermedia]CAA6665144.1 unnamed protein product [Spirodela intermedia]